METIIGEILGTIIILFMMVTVPTLAYFIISEIYCTGGIKYVLAYLGVMIIAYIILIIPNFG